MDVDPRSLSSLVASLNEQITETELKIAALTSSAQRLVTPEVFEELSKEKTPQEDDIDEDVIIEELQKARTELVVSLEKQDFITTKLQAMIADSQLLVSTVVEHFNARDTVIKSEEALFDERCANYKSKVEEIALKDLTDNAKFSTTALKHLQSDAIQLLQSIAQARSKLLVQDYEEKLTKTVDTLNTMFKEMQRT